MKSISQFVLLLAMVIPAISAAESLTVSLQGAHGRFLDREDHNRFLGNSGNKINKFSTFTLKRKYGSGCIRHNSFVNIETNYGNPWQVSANSGLVTLISDYQYGAESEFLFMLENHSNSVDCLSYGDEISLKSIFNHKYIAAESDGEVYANRSKARSLEKFSVILQRDTPIRPVHGKDKNGGIGTCLSVKDNVSDDRIRIVQYDCHGREQQLYWLERIGASNANKEDNVYRIRAKNGHRCLSVAYSSKKLKAEAIVWQWECHGGPNQKFKLEPVAIGVPQAVYRIKPLHTNKNMCLEVEDGSLGNYKQVWQNTCNASAQHQLFDIPELYRYRVPTPIESNLTFGIFGGSTQAVNTEVNDLDGHSIRYTLLTLPQKGTVTNPTANDTGKFTYKANLGVSGKDQFKIRASNGRKHVDIVVTMVIQEVVQVADHKIVSANHAIRFMQLAHTPNRCLGLYSVDVDERDVFSPANDAIQTHCHGGDGQLWQFKPVETGQNTTSTDQSYQIKNYGSGKCLSSNNLSIFHVDCVDSDSSQLFHASKINNTDIYRFKTDNDLCLSFDLKSTAIDKRMVQRSCDSSRSDQAFKLPTVQRMDTSQVLEKYRIALGTITDDCLAPGMYVKQCLYGQVNSGYGSAHVLDAGMQWELIGWKINDEMYYRIKNAQTRQCFEVVDQPASTALRQQRCDGSDNQAFKLRPLPQASGQLHYQIQAKSSGQCITVDSNGDPLEQPLLQRACRENAAADAYEQSFLIAYVYAEEEVEKVSRFRIVDNERYSQVFDPDTSGKLQGADEPPFLSDTLRLDLQNGQMSTTIDAKVTSPFGRSLSYQTLYQDPDDTSISVDGNGLISYTTAEPTIEVFIVRITEEGSSPEKFVDISVMVDTCGPDNDGNLVGDACQTISLAPSDILNSNDDDDRLANVDDSDLQAMLNSADTKKLAVNVPLAIGILCRDFPTSVFTVCPLHSSYPQLMQLSSLKNQANIGDNLGAIFNPFDSGDSMELVLEQSQCYAGEVRDYDYQDGSRDPEAWKSVTENCFNDKGNDLALQPRLTHHEPSDFPDMHCEKNNPSNDDEPYLCLDDKHSQTPNMDRVLDDQLGLTDGLEPGFIYTGSRDDQYGKKPIIEYHDLSHKLVYIEKHTTDSQVSDFPDSGGYCESRLVLSHTSLSIRRVYIPVDACHYGVMASAWRVAKEKGAGFHDDVLKRVGFFPGTPIPTSTHIPVWVLDDSDENIYNATDFTIRPLAPMLLHYQKANDPWVINRCQLVPNEEKFLAADPISIVNKANAFVEANPTSSTSTTRWTPKTHNNENEHLHGPNGPEKSFIDEFFLMKCEYDQKKIAQVIAQLQPADGTSWLSIFHMIAFAVEISAIMIATEGLASAGLAAETAATGMEEAAWLARGIGRAAQAAGHVGRVASEGWMLEMQAQSMVEHIAQLTNCAKADDSGHHRSNLQIEACKKSATVGLLMDAAFTPSQIHSSYRLATKSPFRDYLRNMSIRSRGYTKLEDSHPNNGGNNLMGKPGEHNWSNGGSNQIEDMLEDAYDIQTNTARELSYELGDFNLTASEKDELKADFDAMVQDPLTRIDQIPKRMKEKVKRIKRNRICPI